MSIEGLSEAGSHAGSLKATYRKASSAIAYGRGPARVAQPSSDPGCSMGNESVAPVFGSFTGAYIARAVSTCAGVRQVGPSAPEHASTLGSNTQRLGLSMTPSFTPSSASQA